MEIDISDKVKHWMKYSVMGMAILIVGTVSAVWLWQQSDASLKVTNAHVSGSLVNTTTKVPGTLVELLVEDEAMVKAGTILAKIQVKISPEQLKQLELTVETAKSRYNELLTKPIVAVAEPATGGNATGAIDTTAVDRALKTKEKMDNLFAIGAISALQRDQATAAYTAAVNAYEAAIALPVAVRNEPVPSQQNELLKVAQLQIKQAELALEEARHDLQAADLKAPVDGMVYFNGVQVGDTVTAGQTVFRVGNLHEVWLEAKLLDEQKSLIQLGQFVAYTIVDYPGQSFTGTVYEIFESTALEESDEGMPPEQNLIKISLPNDLEIDFKPGMKAMAKISI